MARKVSKVNVSFGPVLDGNDRYIPHLWQMENRLCVFSDDKLKISGYPESCETGIYHHFTHDRPYHSIRFVTEDRTGERKFRFMRVVEDITDA